ncbi:MAG: TonB-dependent receptor plug domain-containing protein, partial [Prolixibacteraceae bacterium]
MKLTSALILLLVIQVHASVYSQNSKFTIEVKNQSMRDVLRQIEEQSQYRFFYSESLMKLDEKVTIDQKEKSIESLLDVIFNNKNISYEIKENKLIVLRPTDLPQVDSVVSGNVTDSKGDVIPGVTVLLKGTTKGTITDIDGNYSLGVEPNSTLVFSFIGMTTQEISVSGKKTINVVLSENTIGVDEIVVVGYGTVKKANLTGAVSSVDFSDLEGRPASNTATLLQGQMSGVTVSNFNNQPGQDNPQIRIRGIGTMNAGSEPLVIVDGVESSLNQIPSSDIESVSVLKDAASASIYGVRAANGVILVTTKRGKSANPVVSVKQSFAFQQALVKPDLVSSWDYATLQNLDL